jgi:hypothetical protein
VRNPRAVVRGGIGVFQNTPNANLIGNAVDNTGLASAVQQLSCVGTGRTDPRLGRVHDQPGRGADAVRRRLGRIGVRQQRPEREPVRA